MASIYRIATLCIVAVSLALVSCGTQPPNTVPDNLIGAWVLVWWKDPLPLPEVQITLNINGDEVTGNSSCNAYQGKLTIRNSSFRVGELGSTFVLCNDEDEKTEMKFRSLLEAASNWRIVDTTLVLSSGGVDSLRFLSS